MNTLAGQGFARMDTLSSEGIPFFFVVDFLMQNVEIFPEMEIYEKGLMVDFPMFKSHFFTQTPKRVLHWKSFPESLQQFQKGFDLVQKNIRLGNSYLANYTRRTEIEINRPLEDLFRMTKAKYKAHYPGKFIFFSPETFIKTSGNQIYTYPMKGTIDAAVPNAESLLKNDEKELAEHYTVVDLLRNDLSLVADNVTVTKLMRIDAIHTAGKDLLGMSSEISGQVKPALHGKVGTILQKMLPAGSILGAPKSSTLAVVREAEGYERGYYTGVCGWFDGEDLDSCVMIRFIEQQPDGRLFYKSGGGITHLSRAENEYAEMINKIYVPVY